MKVPDKIFKHLTTGDRRLNGHYYDYKPAKIRYDDKIIEYIRKDALIEELNQMSEGTGSSYQKAVIGLLIKKVEAL